MDPISRSFHAMNTSMRILLYPRDERERDDGEQALADAEGVIRAIEARFSRFRESSELCRLNRSSGSWFSVSPDLAEVLELARVLHHETAGIFDPVILDDLERAGYRHSFETIGKTPIAARLATRRPRRRFADVKFQDGDRVWLPPTTRLDLGGIVKGWAADRLVRDLARRGPVLADLGGDIAVSGSPPDSTGWSIGVEAPDDDAQLLAVLNVRGGGVATSGTNRRHWFRGDRPMHHVIDPRCGEPAETDLVQVVALTTSAARADVWAKAALILGTAGCRQLLAERPDLDFLLVPRVGTPSATPGILTCISSIVSGEARDHQSPVTQSAGC
ncbi:MAG TPA: FAD:protein FMN transferase [Chloroflexota bacterium]|nr:FAD:protein FMN transferase [Chloroflexota bacterium]